MHITISVRYIVKSKEGIKFRKNNVVNLYYIIKLKYIKEK
jgi:hypothetical protein